MTMTGLRLPEPEHFDFVSEDQVRALIANAERELSTLERGVADAATGADLAEEQARSAGVDPRLSTRTMLRLQGFLDGLRAEVERDAATVVEQARSQADTRLEAARAVAAQRSERVAPPDQSADPYDLERLRRLLHPEAAPVASRPVGAQTPAPAVDALVVEHTPAPPSSAPPSPTPASAEPPPSAPPTTLIAAVPVAYAEPAPEPAAYDGNGHGIAMPLPVRADPGSTQPPGTYAPEAEHAPPYQPAPTTYEPEAEYAPPYEPAPPAYEPQRQYAPALVAEAARAAPATAPRRRFRVPMSAVLEVVAVLLVLGFLLLRLS